MLALRPNVIAASLFVAFTGCMQGSPEARPTGVKVSGKVLLSNGSPLTGGMLVLRPDSGLFGATALIQPDGTFSLQDTANNEDVVIGKYQVFITFPNANQVALQRSVPRRYQETEDGDSDVYVDIQQPTENLIIRLKG